MKNLYSIINKNVIQNKIFMYSLYLLIGFIAINILANIDALASQQENASEVFSGTFCKVIGIVQGPIGKGVGTFAVIVVAFTWITGKSNWTTTLTVFIAVGAIFGADKIVTLLSGGDSMCENGEPSN